MGIDGVKCSVETDVYITDKAEIKRLPEEKPKPSKKEQRELDKQVTDNKPSATPKTQGRADDHNN